MTVYNMGFLCVARGAFTYAGRLGVYASKHTERHFCSLYLLSGILAPTGIRVKRYSQDKSDRRDVSGQFICHHLPHRTMLKIQGQDTSPFLQGIITNDMGLLEEPGHTALYSHMLNVQGRTLYDIMLYRYSTSIPLVMFT